MPAIIEGHVHIPFSIAFDYLPEMFYIDCSGKAECLEIIQKTIKDNPGRELYTFALFHAMLNGELLTMTDIDSVSVCH